MKKILICEDEKDTREFLAKMLTRNGYEVLCAGDGQTALTLTKENTPDLIITDIRLPKIDGIDVVREIRTFNKTVKIIFLTAFESSEIQKEASRYDISDYLTKPVSFESLIAKVKEIIG